MREKVSKCRGLEVLKKVIRRTAGGASEMGGGEGGARAQARSLSAGHNTLTPAWVNLQTLLEEKP